ncbi:uncharacterized protein LOC111088504 [Limulus polyphemus]|uniref:Uncharacterized protein LOC111088504 n=1 Tax=Limulus polyphemus TaxID=6850 RepID=A0ABM1TF94_LIMPO|nr:uncharacterized protein LOC111088504 [Limulus polyphemus]
MPYIYIETAKEKLCHGAKLLSSGLCNNTLTASALRADPLKVDPHRTVRVVFPDQSTDAIIYVTVVIVFYAAIILILVGTNLHRFRRNGSTRNNSPSDDEEESVELEEKRHLVVHLDKNARVYQTITPEKLNELAL